jgi:hypothetical protein
MALIATSYGAYVAPGLNFGYFPRIRTSKCKL